VGLIGEPQLRSHDGWRHAVLQEICRAIEAELPMEAHR
jgi:hypothetical protein